MGPFYCLVCSGCNNAIRGEVEKCVERAKRYNAVLVFVVPSEAVAKGVKDIVGKVYECMVL